MSETSEVNQYPSSHIQGLPDDFFITEPYLEVSYMEVLNSFHKNLRPRTYFEIGTLFGETLTISDCASLAIDPSFRVEKNVVGEKPSCLMFQMTSDLFFARFDPKTLLGEPIDLAFLDGLHWFEFLLRDFINTEKHCNRNSVIILHDCLPSDSHIARRNTHDESLAAFSPHPGWWAGDVWKVVAILLKYRPDLNIYGSKAAPTGLITITNLDPSSKFLENKYFEIVNEYQGKDCSKSEMQKFLGELQMVTPRDLLVPNKLSSKFWL